MSNETDLPRRQFIGVAAMTVAGSQLGLGVARAAANHGGGLGPIKQINAGALNIGYADVGPASGPPVVLLHGWPYAIDAFTEVAPLLAAAGHRVLVPHLRGYGTTRFAESGAVRNGQPSALASDVTAFMDALKIERATLAGFDWGARTANIV